MNGLLITFLLLASAPIFSAYNDYRYEGENPSWAEADEVENKLAIIERFLPDNPIIFEAGAFNGRDSVKFAKHWPNGTVISFEANPSQFIKYQAKAASFPNMRGYNLALHSYNGFTEFYLCWGTGGTNPEYEGASSLLPSSESMRIHYMGPKITVPCVVLDDWCKANQVSSLDFMWLDLEGFELQLLRSSPKILDTVQVLYTETNFYPFRQGMTQFNELKPFLESQGFTLIAHWYREGLQGDALFVRKQQTASKGEIGL